MARTYLITGGAGYIGSHIVRQLAEGGHSPIVLDNFSGGHRELLHWGTLEEVDLADTAALRGVFTRHRIDAVVHLAAYNSVGESVADPQKYYLNNLVNTINLLRVMREAGVMRMVFSSSCAVYGMPGGMPMTEALVRNPISPYGRTKNAIENVLEDYSSAYGFRSVSLRYFNAAGADPDARIGEWHEPETHLIPLVLDAAAGLRAYVGVFGTDYATPDGTCIRDYIHVDDLGDAHVRALEYLMDGGESTAFNLGNGTGFSVRRIIETARLVTGRDIAERELPRRAGDPPVRVADFSRARDVLGWRQRHADMGEIIETAWQWHRVLQSLR